MALQLDNTNYVKRGQTTENAYIRIMPETIKRHIDKWGRVDPFFTFSYEVWADSTARGTTNEDAVGIEKVKISGDNYDTYFAYSVTQEADKDEIKQAYAFLKEVLKTEDGEGGFNYPTELDN